MRFFIIMRKRGNIKDQRILELFRNITDMCDLRDLGYSGYEFIWVESSIK